MKTKILAVGVAVLLLSGNAFAQKTKAEGAISSSAGLVNLNMLAPGPMGANASGTSSATVTITGVFSATLAVYLSGDCANYVQGQFFDLSSGTPTPTETAIGVYGVQFAGNAQCVKIAPTVYSSGVAGIIINALPGSSGGASGGSSGGGAITAPLGQQTMANSVSVVVASDQTPAINPCQAQFPTPKAINLTANAVLIPGVSAKKIYVCQINFAPDTAEGIAITEGTTVSTPCDTGTLAVLAGTTGALGSGYNFGTGGGISLGMGGFYVTSTTVNANSLCIMLSGSIHVGGSILYVIQ